MKKITSLVIMMFVALASWSQQTVNIGIMLPLHNVDGDGKRMVEYYRGMLLAINKLKQEGQNINVHAWNVNIDADPATTLAEPAAKECNIIFGPLYTKQVKPIADFCQAHDIQMVIPFSISGNEVDTNPHIYQVYESPSEMNEAAIRHTLEKFKDYHAVFIDCNDSTSKKGSFTFPLREEMKKRGITYSITNLKCSDDIFIRSFISSKPILVIPNTGRSPEMRQVMDRLDILIQAHPDLSITLLGYKEWLMYTKYNKERYAKYNAYIPTNFFYNAQSPAMQQFITNYHEAYNQELMNALPQFAVTGYDHIMYFVGKNRSTGSGTASWLQTPLNFVKTPDGGYRNKTFMFVHYNTNGSVDAIQY